MAVSIRILAGILVVCFALLGLLAVFGILPPELLLNNVLELSLAAGVLVAAILVLRLILPPGASAESGKTEPPPPQL